MPAKVTVKVKKIPKAVAVKQLHELRSRYLATVFHPLTKAEWKRASAALKLVGLSMDAVAAGCYRQAIQLCIREIEEWEP